MNECTHVLTMAVYAQRCREVRALYSSKIEETGQNSHLFLLSQVSLSQKNNANVQIPVLGNAHGNAGELSKEPLEFNILSAMG